MMFQLDTGSTCSKVGREGNLKLDSPTVTNPLFACGHKPFDVKRQCSVEVIIAGRIRVNLPMIVVNETGLNLLGLD